MMMKRQRDFFSFIPLDIIRMIFHHLTLKEIAIFDNAVLNHESRPCFLEALNGFPLDQAKKTLNSPSEIKWLLSRHVSLTEFGIQSFWHDPRYQEDCMALISQNRSTLRSIEFPTSYFDDKFFNVIILCPKLTSMNFEGAVNLTADAIVALLSHESQSQLTSLNISRSQSWTSKSIALIAQKCPKLESLRLTSLRFVSDRDIQALVQGCRHFRTLGVSRTSISDHSIHLLLEAYPSIEVLEVENCPRVTFEGQFAVMRIIIKQHLMSSDPDRQLIGTQSIRRVLSDGISSFLCPLLWLSHLLIIPLSRTQSYRWIHLSWSRPNSCSISHTR
jgi:hypothetical protein